MTKPAEQIEDLETCSENEAAVILDVPRSTLAYWRRGGELRSDLVRGQQARYGTPKTRSSLRYDRGLITKIAAGEATMFETDTVAGD